MRPSHTRSWSVTGPFTFVLTLSAPYDPALIELSIIRPLRFLSPASFFTDAPGDNSCPANRGNVTKAGIPGWLLCRGIKSPMGTGPYKFVVRWRQRGCPNPPRPPSPAAHASCRLPKIPPPPPEQENNAWPRDDARQRQLHRAAARRAGGGR
jgi:hypothetical protein